METMRGAIRLLKLLKECDLALLPPIQWSDLLVKFEELFSGCEGDEESSLKEDLMIKCLEFCLKNARYSWSRRYLKDVGERVGKVGGGVGCLLVGGIARLPGLFPVGEFPLLPMVKKVCVRKSLIWRHGGK